MIFGTPRHMFVTRSIFRYLLVCSVSFVLHDLWHTSYFCDTNDIYLFGQYEFYFMILRHTSFVCDTNNIYLDSMNMSFVLYDLWNTSYVCDTNDIYLDSMSFVLHDSAHVIGL